MVSRNKPCQGEFKGQKATKKVAVYNSESRKTEAQNPAIIFDFDLHLRNSCLCITSTLICRQSGMIHTIPTISSRSRMLSTAKIPTVSQARMLKPLRLV